MTFVVTDVEKVWEEDKLFSILEKAVLELASKLEFDREIKFDAVDILGDMPMGKYYCPMCQNFSNFRYREILSHVRSCLRNAWLLLLI